MFLLESLFQGGRAISLPRISRFSNKSSSISFLFLHLDLFQQHENMIPQTLSHSPNSIKVQSRLIGCLKGQETSPFCLRTLKIIYAHNPIFSDRRNSTNRSVSACVLPEPAEAFRTMEWGNSRLLAMVLLMSAIDLFHWHKIMPLSYHYKDANIRLKVLFLVSEKKLYLVPKIVEISVCN